MPARRVLVITYPYPPMPTVGGNRWLAIPKYLRRMGHEVEVLTTGAFGELPDDAAEGVHRTGDLMAAGWLRALLRRPPLPQGGETAAVDKPPPGVITRVLVPDAYVATWVPIAARAARRLVRDGDFDCVVTTSAYESTHLIPLALGRRRPPWIADFRDGWTFHPWKPAYPTGLQTALDRRLERRVVRTAERTVVVERPVGEDFRERLGIDAGYVPNGWDPDLDAEADAAAAGLPELPAGRVLLVHTGKLSGGWGRSPRPLFDAMARLRREAPVAADRLALVLAGRLDVDEQALIESLDLGEMIVHVGQLSRAGSIALQRRADVLVLLTSPDLVWELPGKVFEYFGARRPILAIAQGNEAERLVRETNTGLTVSPRDVEGIAALLRRIAEEGGVAGYEPRGLERYVYPAPAEAMAEEIERAIAVREGAGS